MLSERRKSCYLPLAYAAAAPTGRGESPLAKFLIGGGVTVAVETLLLGHFCEFLKIAKQTSSDSYWTITRNIVAKKGAAGIVDGFLPWGMLQALTKGAVFSWGQAISMNVLRGVPGISKDTATVLSGGIGGAVQGLCMSPVLLLKTRVMTDPAYRSSGGVLETAASSARLGGKVLAKEGMAGLFKGVGLFSLKRSLDWTTRYFFVVVAENSLKKSSGKQKLSGGEEALASFIGGALSALSTLPIDVAVASRQSAAEAGQKSMSFVQSIRARVEKEGWGKTLAYSSRGYVARTVHVSLTTWAMKNVRF